MAPPSTAPSAPAQHPAGAEADRYASFTTAFRAGGWRAPLFFDLVAADLGKRGPQATVLDIGCGRGFDDDLDLQNRMAAGAARFIGVEPDPSVALGAHFTQTHRCAFEDAPIAPNSIDVAYAIMVLEHLSDPGRFWDKLHETLAPGGVFWGMTVDARSLFGRVSHLTEKLRIKELYMRLLMGERGEDRYLNYPTRYLANRPEDLAPLADRFTSVEVRSFAKHGQHRPAVPGWLGPVFDRYDALAVARGWPGALLTVRLEK